MRPNIPSPSTTLRALATSSLSVVGEGNWFGWATISLCADVVLQCYANNGDLIQQYHCQSAASFEITSAEHNQAMQREFARIPAPEVLFLEKSQHGS